jgi:Mg-chelatase subunit ChlD
MNAERRHFYLLVVVFSCLAVLLAVLAGSARAESASDGETTVLFILDGSGSMWGQIDDQAKITIAKDVMTDLVRDLPETIDVGLLAYGHRRKGDCKDIEILVPPGEGDSTSLTSAIQAITPKGKTPITRSLEVAAEQLRALEEEATVVLVSDGEETCEADPCARVRALKAEGINVTVHVVGFDVNDTERRQLTCIADAGGGRYFTADNAPQLQEAFREVKQEIVQKTEPQPAAETTKATQRTIAIAAGMIVAPRLQHDQVQVKDAESGTSIVMLSPKQTRTPVPAGSYAIELNGSMMTIEVAAGETVELPPPAVIKIANFDAHGAGGTPVTVRNVDSGHGKILHRGEPSAEFWPGSYQVDLGKAFGGVHTVTVAAGEQLTFDLAGTQ